MQKGIKKVVKITKIKEKPSIPSWYVINPFAKIIFSTNWKEGSVLSKPIKRRREIKKVIKEVHKATDLELRFEDSSLPWGISKMNKTPTNGRKVIIDNKFQFSIL